MARPLISIITATYDFPVGLLGAINSVDRQTWGDWEHIIVGDGDPSLQKTQDACGMDSRRRWVNLDARANDMGRTPINAGLSGARGQWVAILSDDNLWYPDHLSGLLEIVKQNSAARFVYGGSEVRRVDGGDRCFRFHRWPMWTMVDLGEFLYQKSLFNEYGDYKAGEFSYDWVKIEEFLRGGEEWACERKCNFIFYNNPCALPTKLRIMELAGI